VAEQLARIRGYLDRLSAGWDRTGVLGPALDAALRTIAAAEASGAQQVPTGGLLTAIAAELGIARSDDAAPVTEPCAHCSHPVRWVTTGTGARMSVDAEPHPERGLVQLQLVGGRAVAIPLTRGRAATLRGQVDLYIAHRDTCPYAHKWR
jgi:hypothetical protein